MNRTDLLVVGAIIVVFVFLCVFYGVIQPGAEANRCTQLGETIHRPTRILHSECQILIAPDLFVDQNKIEYYLDSIVPVDDYWPGDEGNCVDA